MSNPDQALTVLAAGPSVTIGNEFYAATFREQRLSVLVDQLSRVLCGKLLIGKVDAISISSTGKHLIWRVEGLPWFALIFQARARWSLIAASVVI